MRAYGNLANEMDAAGYTDAEAAAIKAEVAHYAAVRDEVKLGAGEDIDFKQYEAGMRFLLDTYIQADASETVADFEDTGLIQLIVQMGDGGHRQAAEGHQERPRGGRRDDRQQRAQGHHRRARDEPEVLRQDVRAARRPDRGSGSKEALDYKEYLDEAARHSPQQARHAGVRHRLSRTGPDNGAKRALIDFGLPEETWPSPSTRPS